ncbi:hypothetical protein QFZ79_003064 [Arthrobacter sp. V4I6]|nr:hypothetical protein [Arthrobacter sp. V1I7]MDQ0854953.1 hypothetical protein [Arthrobacter sp. V4I6]
MAWREREIDVDRELVLNVDVMESGVVRLQLIGGGVKAELGPGDRFVLVLRPPSQSTINPTRRRKPGLAKSSASGITVAPRLLRLSGTRTNPATIDAWG